jgi:serine/threonine protein kinase
VTLLSVLQVGTAMCVPQQVVHNFSGAPQDGALVDVWACGIVLFMLLFGRHLCLCRLPSDAQLSVLHTPFAPSLQVIMLLSLLPPPHRSALPCLSLQR